MTRLARALALLAWAATLAVPAAAPAGAHHPLMAELCSADGTQTIPLDRDDPTAAAGCPCCTASGTAALPPAAPGGLAAATAAAQPLGAGTATFVAALAPLPPSRGPPA
jgi:hypothetical protein